MTSLVTRVNPLALLVVGLACVFGSLAVRDLDTGLVAVGLYAAAVVSFTPSLRYAAICLGFSLFAGLTVAWSTWRLGGHDEAVAATAAVRIVVLAWPGSVVAGYVDPVRLGDHLAQNLRLPARPVAATTGALQQLGSIADAWSQISRARRARGIADHGLGRLRSIGPMTFALLVASLRSAGSRAVAMDARGFVTAQGRTWAEPAPWSRLDVVAAVLGVTLAVVPLVLHLT